MVKIYKLYSKSRIEDIYIGACTCELNSRLSQHKWDGKNKNSKKSKWIKEILDTTNDLVIEKIDECLFENYQEIETKYITQFSKTHNLLNNRLLGNGMILGRQIESIQRSASAKYVPILQYDLNGNLLKEWNSLKEAAEYYNSISGSINNCLKGLSCSAIGYFWRYKNKESKRRVKIIDRKSICKYTIKIINKVSLEEIIFNKGLRNLIPEYGLSNWTVGEILPKKGVFENDLYKFICTIK